IHVYGARYDDEPYIALARRLQLNGYSVQLAGPRRFTQVALRHGVLYEPLPDDLLALSETHEGRRALAAGSLANDRVAHRIHAITDDLLQSEWRAAHTFWPDLMVYHPKSIASPHMAERVGCRSIMSSPLPILTPTSAFPTPKVPFRTLGPLNRLSHTVAEQHFTRLFRKPILKWRRKTLGLPERPRLRHAPDRKLYAYSRHLVPVPRDWGRHIHVTGAWWLEEPERRLSAELAAFLTSGPPPVYVALAGMPEGLVHDFAFTAVRAARMVGKRVLLATAGGPVGILRSSEVLAVADMPLDQVFTRADMIFHHGGAATTAAALRAGKPSAICPVFSEGHFWARRVHDLGAGPPPVKVKRLSVEGIAVLMHTMDTPFVREKVRQLSSQMRDEGGIDDAVRVIEQLEWNNWNG
ncbi:glycosyltransferase, partial [Ensifer sp. SSB1]|uniref:glycosyltransferase n=1 Tax=Ensifer sp. SSB1 TaxID=2795385 RepID=UPI001A5550DB